ncbi:MAG: bifunctional DNA-formamidopyrimidine glycosylase/DNA-(apurinic or apyrimidinic site) lyase [Pseudohongiellaceae bacterium]
MPELPEVETTRRGIEPHVSGQFVQRVTIRQPQLRWPVAPEISSLLPGQRIDGVRRRGKYLLFDTTAGSMLVHLGMSGSLRVLTGPVAARLHDHVDFCLDSNLILRFNDPRRFGSILWAGLTPQAHPLLDSMGPEPLSPSFTGTYLYDRSRGRKVPVKHFLMDSSVVPGVGNIYANEALHSAGIHPLRAAGRVSRVRYEALVKAVREVLDSAIAMGGTTLRDFVGSDGRPGYFRQSLNVYGRAGLPCRSCGRALKEIRSGQRSTVYCGSCQR